MGMTNYIAIDLGATSGRVILSHVCGSALSMDTVHRFPTPLVEKDGRYYWDINLIHDEIVKGIDLALATGEKVESIGIDTWGVDFACFDGEGRLIGLPRAYRDPYTRGVPEEFFKTMPRQDLYRRTGIQIMDFNSVFQLYAQKRDPDSPLQTAAHVLFMPDALSYMLTGNMVCEYTILSTSALMDPRTKKIDREILDVCGISPELFPEIVYPGTKVGEYKGIPVIAVAGHDTGSAVAAVPAADSHFAYLSSGTWSLMGIEAQDAIIDEKMFSLNITNEGGVGGTTRVLKNITGMWLLEQCLARWRSEGREYSYAQLARMAQSCPASSGVIDPDDPAFAAPTDMPAAIIGRCRDLGFAVPEDDAAIVRLIYDSLAAKYAEVFGSLCEIAPFSIDALHIIGGGSQNELLDQMTADACGVKVVAGPSECTALGNVMVQAGLSRTELAGKVETRLFLPTIR